MLKVNIVMVHTSAREFFSTLIASKPAGIHLSLLIVHLDKSSKMPAPPVTLHDFGYTLLKTFQVSNGCAVALAQKTDGQLVVTKTFTSSHDQLAYGQRLPKEVRVIKRLLPHENIVNLIAEIPNAPATDDFTLVLKFCNGGNMGELAEYMDKYGVYIPENWLWHIFIQLARTLAHCERKMVTHSDLHLGQFLFHFSSKIEGAFPNVVLADFELANQRSDDLYFLGACLNSLMTNHGKPPGGWSKELEYWVQRCHESTKKPLKAQVLQDKMIPVAEAILDKFEDPLVLPPWAIRYFQGVCDQTAKAVEKVRQDPFDEEDLWRRLTRLVHSAGPQEPSNSSFSEQSEFEFVESLEARFALRGRRSYRDRFYPPRVGGFVADGIRKRYLEKLRYVSRVVEAEVAELLKAMEDGATGPGWQAQRRRILNASNWAERLGKMVERLDVPQWKDFMKRAESAKKKGEDLKARR